MFQAYSAIFTTLDILRHILSTLGYILSDSGMFRILAQLGILIYIKAYSEPRVYSRIFRTIDIFSQVQARYSGITREQVMLILNLI